MPTHRIDQKLSRIVYDLDDKDIVAEVARTGEMEVVVGWDEERFNPSVADPAEYQDRVSYFIPVKQKDRVLAVLATGSRIVEKEEVLHRIEVMQPLLDQVAIALEHARLYGELQSEVTRRKQTEEALTGQAVELSEAIKALEERDRLLAAFHRIGQTILSFLYLDEILDNLARQIIEAGVFRSLMIALVNEQAHRVEVKGSYVRALEEKQSGSSVVRTRTGPI